ncbi:MAG: hypothetical protein HZB80_02100 [Deltaproteobacteria bacterium]|nr:hypothetical protein [Deltaproteobacteria bacterium]
MMQSLFIAVLIIIIAIIGNFFAISRVSSERNLLREKEGTGLILPSSVYKVIALEFKGIFSDIMFSRAMTYYGGKLIRNEKPTEKEWGWIYRNMDAATDLDHYFLDPYYFGAMTLAWDANKVKESNILLEKAFRYRDWDWTIPFYLGFNHFYFLQDNEKAAYYLMEGAKRPGGSGGLLPTLAARLSYQGKKTENAIIFLQEMLKKTDDKNVRWIYERRLAALKAILFLEGAAAAYQNRFKARPDNLDGLIAKGIISELPQDPYGGKFYMDKDGLIKTTSEMR